MGRPGAGRTAFLIHRNNKPPVRWQDGGFVVC
jgi:hypothetical protein